MTEPDAHHSSPRLQCEGAHYDNQPSLAERDVHVKQIRIEPATCNNDVNKEKRRVFAERCAQRGQRAVVKLPPSKGVNLQVQCAVSSAIGLVTYRLQRGGIRIDKSAVFVEEIYKVVKASSVFQNCFRNKKIVIVLDNAPAHHQTEERVTKHPDMELLHLGPYSPMCNSIEGCFNVLKAHIKNYLAVYRDDSCGR
ncbi:hypothetical protein PC110_g8440 [Phytophthora cactorum]|uniref:Tc1-like transposase DDE domain-containing protein n=1 Tax=Phytophthora cactorum TaxID=29920 RepID=A0A329SEK1_9STRA|nr:hypothetical protein PC110_g8440 [Phytophthora cactorum]